MELKSDDEDFTPFRTRKRTHPLQQGASNTSTISKSLKSTPTRKPTQTKQKRKLETHQISACISKPAIKKFKPGERKTKRDLPADKRAQEIHNKVDESPSDSISCFLCGISLSALSLQARQIHVNACLDSQNMGSQNMGSQNTHSQNTHSQVTPARTDSKESVRTPPQSPFFTRHHSGTHSAPRTSIPNPTRVKSMKQTTFLTRSQSFPTSKKQMTLDAFCRSQSNSPTKWGQGNAPSSKTDHNAAAKSSWKQILSVPKSNSDVGKSNGKSKWKSFGKSKKTSKKSRECPFYKIIEGTNFVVDGFGYKPSKIRRTFFLSHYHSDHYGGLTKKFDEGVIYCSEVTAKLVKKNYGLSSNNLKPLPMDVRLPIPETPGTFVTLLDANHCPGAVLFFFELPNSKTCLHCGDFRYHPRMNSYPAFSELQVKVGSLIDGEARVASGAPPTMHGTDVSSGRNNASDVATPLGNAQKMNKGLDLCYLDTTYCEPKYVFPPQDECITFVAKTVAEILESSNEDCLILIGTYSIGKEKILLEVAKETGRKIFVDPKKFHTLQLLNLPCSFEDTFTTDISSTCIHVTTMWNISFRLLWKSVGGRYTRVVGFKPTGWSGEIKKQQRGGNLTIYEVPYSEHSAFNELQEFVRSFQPRKIIPTVNNSNKANVQRMVNLLKTRPRLAGKRNKVHKQTQISVSK